MKLILVNKGGSGSGHRGHSGRPGEVGGSTPGTGAPAVRQGARIIIVPEMRGYNYKVGDKYVDNEGNRYRIKNVVSATRLNVVPLKGKSSTIRYNTHEKLYEYEADAKQGVYKPKSKIEAWILSGNEPSNYSYGAARILKPLWTKVKVGTRDLVEVLPGGVFLLSGGKGQRKAVIFRTPSFAPFERNYGAYRGQPVPTGAMEFLGRNYKRLG